MHRESSQPVQQKKKKKKNLGEGRDEGRIARVACRYCCVAHHASEAYTQSSRGCKVSFEVRFIHDQQFAQLRRCNLYLGASEQGGAIRISPVEFIPGAHLLANVTAIDAIGHGLAKMVRY